MAITIRELTGERDYEACVELQRLTWGEDFRELVPPAILLVAQKIGGLLAGAVDEDDRLLGFVFGFSGFREGRPVHWSHMLAVRPEYRDRGIGRRLKLYQRERLVAQGITTMLWTYDPLVARNAHLNLNRLGARVREYVPNLYGDNPFSVMDNIIGTDRFIVEWRLDVAPPGSPPLGDSRGPIVETAAALEGGAWPSASEIRVAIPLDIQEVKLRAPEEARRFRMATRAAFQHYLGLGYHVAGLIRGTDCCYYVLRARRG